MSDKETTAEGYYLTKDWGNPSWDRNSATMFSKSEMFDFAEHYAKSYHKEQMEKLLDEERIEKMAIIGKNQLKENIPLSNGYYLGFKNCAEKLGKEV